MDSVQLAGFLVSVGFIVIAAIHLYRQWKGDSGHYERQAAVALMFGFASFSSLLHFAEGDVLLGVIDATMAVAFLLLFRNRRRGNRDTRDLSDILPGWTR